MTIKRQLILCLAVISVIVTGLIATIVVKQWNSFQALTAASQAVRAVTLLSQATIELSLERSLTQVALNLDSVIDPAIHKLLKQQRIKADALFSETQAELLASDKIVDNISLANRLDGYLTKIDALRERVDPLLATVIGDRTTQEIRDIPNSIKSHVYSLKNLGQDLRGLMEEAPESIRIADVIIQNAWAIREFGGRERTILAIATARREPISRLDLAYMFENQGHAL